MKKKVETNNEYDKSILEKYGEEGLQKLKTAVYNYFHNKAKKYDLYKEVPKLIKENEELWKTKNFYTPRRKWRELWAAHEEVTLKK